MKRVTLTLRKSAVMAYCAYMNLHDDHKGAMKMGVEVLRVTYPNPTGFDEKEAGVQLLRDLMVTGLLRVGEPVVKKGRRK